MTLLRTLITTSALLLTGLSQAAPIVVGNMSRDVAGNSPYINDSLNNRQWLGWDVTKGLTYAQTVAATQAGGQFAGFSMAHNVDAQLFVDALVGAGNPCTVSGFATCKYDPSEPLREQLLGESDFDYRSAPFLYRSDQDIVFFLSDNGVGREAGYILNVTDDAHANNDFVNKENEWGRIVDVDIYFSGSNNTRAAGWLLYRASTNNVPEPASLALLGLGVLGLAALRRR